jgi:hypothetical protein
VRCQGRESQERKDKTFFIFRLQRSKKKPRYSNFARERCAPDALSPVQEAHSSGLASSSGLRQHQQELPPWQQQQQQQFSAALSLSAIVVGSPIDCRLFLVDRSSDEDFVVDRLGFSCRLSFGRRLGPAEAAARDVRSAYGDARKQQQQQQQPLPRRGRECAPQIGVDRFPPNFGDVDASALLLFP